MNPFEQATNLAVPGHTVNDALYRLPVEDDPITRVVLGPPGEFTGTIKSQVEWAEALDPTFVFVWIGNNDVLGFATKGGTIPLTPIEDFERDYQEVLHRLEATGADLVVANIPDVTAIAFFVTAEEVAEQVGLDLAVIGPILGIQDGDLVTLEGLPLVEKILTQQMLPPLPDDVVLDVLETAQASQAVADVNKIIAREAYRRNIPLVNINFLFKYVSIFGVSANGKRLNTNFLGGIFSLDGVHPTNTGYAVVANHFIRTLNFRYRARIPRVNINKVAKNDPLVIPELLPDTCDFKKALFKAKFGDAIGQFKSVMHSHHKEAP